MKLYLIATGDYPEDEFVERVRESLKGGVDWVQLRIKNQEKLKKVGIRLNRLRRNLPFVFIVNDFPGIAEELGADGVHIGKNDPSLREIRQNFRGIIGVSCYNEIERALKAEREGADYVAFGSLFPTRTKENYVLVEFDTIKAAKRRLKIPICVIGGINRRNFLRVLSLEPDLIAISSAIFSAPAPAEEAAFFKEKMLYYLSLKEKGGKMKENELKETLLRENPEFRELYEKHREYEMELEKLLSRRPLSPEEEVEVKKIKKLKLKIKDKMQEILVKEREKRIG